MKRIRLLTLVIISLTLSHAWGSDLRADIPESDPTNITANDISSPDQFTMGQACMDTVVTTTADSGPGSLRQVILDACGGAHIVFDPSLVGDTIRLTTGEIVVNKELHLHGLGMDQITISGEGVQRVFRFVNQTSVSLSDLTICSGKDTANQGGNIYNDAHLLMERVAVREANGGGIYNLGGLTLSYCEVTGNKKVNLGPDGGGGGIENAGGNMDIKYSLIAENEVAGWLDVRCSPPGYFCSGMGYPAEGGGIYNEGAMNIFASTIVDNKVTGGISFAWKGPACPADGYGGGIYNENIMTISNATIARNTGQGGSQSVGGIYNKAYLQLHYSSVVYNQAIPLNLYCGPGFGASGLENLALLEMSHNIIASNGANIANSSADFTMGPSASVISQGHNLIGDESTYPRFDASYQMKPLATDIVGGLAISGGQEPVIDAMLDTLADNGGPTPTVALLPGSPAIDAGYFGSKLSTDQRNYYRPVGDLPDIGAFEAGSGPMIRIVDPVQDDTFPFLSQIDILASLPSRKTTFLKVSCPDNQFRKLQLANNPNSKWGPRVDVTAGGNNRLKLVLRDPNQDIDWSRIKILPDGISQQAVVVGDYLPRRGIGPDWTSVEIPLSAFYAGINFSNLAYFELPFSAQAGPFEMHIREVSFVGGNTPYLWFGPGKTDNAINNPGSYLLTGEIIEEHAPLVQPEEVQFYADGLLIGRDSVAPYEAILPGAQGGDYRLTAVAVMEYGNTFESPLVDIFVRPAQVVITHPLDNSSFIANDDIPIAAEVQGIVGESAFLQVISPDNKWRKLKLGNNAQSIWSPSVDVTAGGNTHLEVTLRDPNENIDWSKIEVHPQGFTANPVVLGDYLPLEGIGQDWVTLSIPLADFDANINWTQLSLLEIPYSQAAGPFEMHILEILFTGGSAPYTWFGNGKTDNKHDGFGGSGQLLAQVQSAWQEVKQVAFFANGDFIGVDSLAPYQVVWQHVAAGTYSLTAEATLTTGQILFSTPVLIQINTNQRMASEEKPAFEVEAYPNPVTDLLNLEYSAETEGSLQLSLIDLTGRVWYRDMFDAKAGNHHLKINLNSLPEGIYLLQLLSEDRIWRKTVRIVKLN